MTKRRGFTLIELLIVVAIIGIIVAIAVVNMLNAIQRARQKRTMADMKTVATAVEAYAVDWNAYPAAAGFSMPSGLSLPTGTLGSVSASIAPTYLRMLPLVDGWSSYFTYGASTAKSDYVLRSTGADGIAETTPAFGGTTDFNADIILVDSIFVQFPEGAQK
jgi:type II secretion system protein G